MQSQPIGWLIVGHGTRNSAGLLEFQQLSERLKALSTVPTAACFLELAEPTIAQGLERLASQGVTQVVVIPLLLFSAGHAKLDIPTAVNEAAQSLGLTILAQTSPLEHHPRLLQLSRENIQSAMEGTTGDATHVLLVGRGSSDSLAIHQVQQYGQLLSDAMSLPVSVAFVAAAQPSLPQALQILAEGSCRRIVVLPHLLFRGDVLETIQAAVEKMRTAYPQHHWLLAHHLGTHNYVAEAILARIQETLNGLTDSV